MYQQILSQRNSRSNRHNPGIRKNSNPSIHPGFDRLDFTMFQNDNSKGNRPKRIHSQQTNKRISSTVDSLVDGNKYKNRR